MIAGRLTKQPVSHHVRLQRRSAKVALCKSPNAQKVHGSRSQIPQFLTRARKRHPRVIGVGENREVIQGLSIGRLGTSNRTAKGAFTQFRLNSGAPISPGAVALKVTRGATARSIQGIRRDGGAPVFRRGVGRGSPGGRLGNVRRIAAQLARARWPTEPALRNSGAARRKFMANARTKVPCPQSVHREVVGGQPAQNAELLLVPSPTPSATPNPEGRDAPPSSWDGRTADDASGQGDAGP